MRCSLALPSRTARFCASIANRRGRNRLLAEACRGRFLALFNTLRYRAIGQAERHFELLVPAGAKARQSTRDWMGGNDSDPMVA